MRFFPMFLFIFILFSSLVSALGVTPTIQNFYYDPGATVQGSFDVWNNELVPVSFQISLSGPLAPLIHLEKRAYTLEPDQWTTIPYTLNIPPALTETTVTSFYLSSLPPQTHAALGIIPSIQLETRVRIILPSTEVMQEKQSITNIPTSSPSVLITNFTVSAYEQGQFIKFNFFVENSEITSLTDVHTLVTITTKDTDFTTELASPPFSVAPISSYPVELLWNLPDPSSHAYTFTTTLYQARTELTHAQTHLQLSPTEAHFMMQPSRTSLTLGITLFLFVLLFNILYVLYRKYAQ